MKKQRGITLISLVVTIIVLIILAGVSINIILGKDGIINKAKEAKENIELAQIEEQEQLNELYDQMSAENGSISYDAASKLVEFKREIASAITDMGVSTSENADVNTMANNIRSILGTLSADKISYDNTNSGLTSTNVQGAVDEINEFKQFTASAYGLNLVINKVGRICEWKLTGTTTQELLGTQYYIITDLTNTEFKPLSPFVNIAFLSTNGVCGQVQPRLYSDSRAEFEIGFFSKNGNTITLPAGSNLFTHGTYISAN